MTTPWRAGPLRADAALHHRPGRPEGGAGQLHGSEELMPAEVVSQLKGRDMMVDRFAEMLGVTKS